MFTPGRLVPSRGIISRDITSQTGLHIYKKYILYIFTEAQEGGRLGVGTLTRIV